MTISKVNIDELATQLAEKKNNLTVEECSQLIKLVFNEITCGIERGEKTSLRVFGTFVPVIHAPSKKRNPGNGEAISAGYTGSVIFKPCSKLKQSLIIN